MSQLRRDRVPDGALLHNSHAWPRPAQKGGQSGPLCRSSIPSRRAGSRGCVTLRAGSDLPALPFLPNPRSPALIRRPISRRARRPAFRLRRRAPLPAARSARPPARRTHDDGRSRDHRLSRRVAARSAHARTELRGVVGGNAAAIARRGHASLSGPWRRDRRRMRRTSEDALEAARQSYTAYPEGLPRTAAIPELPAARPLPAPGRRWCRPTVVPLLPAVTRRRRSEPGNHGGGDAATVSSVARARSFGLSMRRCSSGLDRQLVLVDVVGALNAGPHSFDDIAPGAQHRAAKLRARWRWPAVAPVPVPHRQGAVRRHQGGPRHANQFHNLRLLLRAP